MSEMNNLLTGIIGIVLLTLGRRLFWLFVACVGFTVGLQVAHQYLGAQPYWAYWGIALLFGIIGALVAVFFQSLAIGLSGFAAGTTIGAYLATMMGLTAVPLAAFFGGVVAMLVLYLVFDWALIVLSSVVGGTLIVQVLNWNPQAAMVLYLVLIAAGIWFQASLRNGPTRKNR
jgi:hypothetical protein